MEIILVFIFGLIVGSFLNAVIYRLHKGEKIMKGRSHCPWCQRQLKWYELIPVLSFIIQKERCRYCGHRISWQYPLVELATAILFVLSFWAVKSQSQQVIGFWLDYSQAFFYLQVLRAFVFASFLLVIFVYDLKYYLILDKIVIPAMFVGLLFNILLYLSWRYVLLLLLSAAVAGGFFFFQYAVSQGKWIGGGDVYLGLVMGLMLGWPQVTIALVIAYIIGALFSLVLLAFKKKKLDSRIPFGTFLAIATFLALFWSEVLYDWYANFLYHLI